MKRFFVYMARCADGTLYTGWSDNPERRIEVHNTGKGAKYTRSRRPIVLVYTEEAVSLSAVKQREHTIKRLTRTEKEQLIVNKQTT